MPTRTRALSLAAAALVALIGLVFLGQWLGARYLSPERGVERIELSPGDDCTPTGRVCEASAGDVSLALELAASPRALVPFPVRVQVRGLSPETITGISIDFEMQGMDMGLNRARLQPGPSGPGTWAGEATLPVCTAGRTDWLARVSVAMPGRLYEATFPFSTFQ